MGDKKITERTSSPSYASGILRHSEAGRVSSSIASMHSLTAQRQLPKEMPPVMSMTLPKIITSFTLTMGKAPLTVPASAGAVVVHEVFWCVLQSVSCCGLV